VADLKYRVSDGRSSVLFSLNDLASVKPPAKAIRDGEIYLGPVFDESAIRFFLIFEPKLKVFYYVLDETVPAADELVASEDSDRILIGARTGFAFYRDDHADRKILLGVNADNTGVNNYLDGPFDQLPDNFLKGDALLKAILAVEPSLAGTLDRFGNTDGDATRYLIAPYMQYEDPRELTIVEDCTDNEPIETYYSCFSFAPLADEEPPTDDDPPASGEPPAEDQP
jgi:hypothetical protein